jgi:hypothetical protein
MNSKKMDTRKMDTRKMDKKSNVQYELNEVDLSSVEELETAIAPGAIGFGCGCRQGNLGIYCG